MIDILILNGALPKESEFKAQKLTIIADKNGTIPVTALPLFSKKTVDVVQTNDIANTVEIAFKLGQIAKPDDNIISSDPAFKNLFGREEKKKRTRKASRTAEEQADKKTEKPAASVANSTASVKETRSDLKSVPDNAPIRTDAAEKTSPSEVKDTTTDPHAYAESADDADKQRESDFLKAYDKKKLPEEWKEEGKRLLKLAIDKPSLLILSGNLPKECPKEVQEAIVEIVQKIKKL